MQFAPDLSEEWSLCQPVLLGFNCLVSSKWPNISTFGISVPEDTRRYGCDANAMLRRHFEEYSSPGFRKSVCRYLFGDPCRWFVVGPCQSRCCVLLRRDLRYRRRRRIVFHSSKTQ